MMNLRQQLFVNYYLGEANGNGSKAARLAGFPHAAVMANRLLRNVKIQEAIAERVSSVAMKADEVLLRISRLASTDMTDFLKVDDGTGIPSLDLRKAKRRQKLDGIKKVKASRVNRGPDLDPIDVVELELHDPFKALVQLAKYHGIDGMVETPIDYDKLSREELEAIAKGQSKR